MRTTISKIIMSVMFMGIVQMSAGYAQVKNRLELGMGGMKTKQYLDLLVKVSNTTTIGEESGRDDDFFVMVKVAADGTLDGKNLKDLNYLDFTFEVVPSVDIYDDGNARMYVGYNLLSYKQQKNIDIDMDHQYQLSVLGFRFGGHAMLNDSDLKLFGQFSVDLVSVLFDAKRFSDGVALSGKEYGTRGATGLDTFIGLEKIGKYRIVLGAQVHEVDALGHDEGDVYCDEYGCYDYTSTNYDENWVSSKLYLDASVNLTKALSIFGRASYNVFKMTDKTEYFPSTKNTAWQLMLGVKYRLFSGKN